MQRIMRIASFAEVQLAAMLVPLWCSTPEYFNFYLIPC